MLRIKKEYFRENPTIREVADKSELSTSTLSRIVNGKQSPGFGEGQSAERIACALGWTGDPAELFAEVGE